MEFYEVETALISDVKFKGWQETLSSIGGISITISSVISMLFSISIYNEWQRSLVNSITDEQF